MEHMQYTYSKPLTVLTYRLLHIRGRVTELWGRENFRNRHTPAK